MFGHIYVLVFMGLLGGMTYCASSHHVVIAIVLIVLMMLMLAWGMYSSGWPAGTDQQNSDRRESS